MDASSPPANHENNLNLWIKPLALIVAVFIVGFAIPVLLKNYLGEKTGIAPPTPTQPPVVAQLTGPSYRFEPEQVTLAAEESTQIKVYLNTDKQEIEAFDFVASYDPAVVEVTAVEATPLFPSYPAIEYGEGTITIGGNIGIDSSFSVKDLMAIITVKGKTAGAGELTLDKNLSTIAAKGENILNDSNSVKIEVK